MQDYSNYQRAGLPPMTFPAQFPPYQHYHSIPTGNPSFHGGSHSEAYRQSSPNSSMGVPPSPEMAPSTPHSTIRLLTDLQQKLDTLATSLAQMQAQAVTKDHLNSVVTGPQLEAACRQMEQNLYARITPALAESTERIQLELVAKISATEAFLLAALSDNQCPPPRQPPQPPAPSQPAPTALWTQSSVTRVFTQRLWIGGFRSNGRDDEALARMLTGIFTVDLARLYRCPKWKGCTFVEVAPSDAARLLQRNGEPHPQFPNGIKIERAHQRSTVHPGVSVSNYWNHLPSTEDELPPPARILRRPVPAATQDPSRGLPPQEKGGRPPKLRGARPGGEAALRSTSSQAAPKANPPGPRGERTAAPSGAASGPPPHPTSAPSSDLPPADATAARAELRTAEPPHRDTPRPVLHSPAQEEPEDSDHEQALAGSKPRRRPTARAAQTDRATAHLPGPSAQDTLSMQTAPAQELTSQQLAPAAAPAQCQPPPEHLQPAEGSHIGPPEQSTTQTPAPSKTAGSEPTPQRRSRARRRPATSGRYGSDAAASSRREAPSPDPTDPEEEDQAPVQPARAYPNLQGPNSPATIRRYWTKSRNSNIYTFRAKLWHAYHTQTNASAGIPFEGRAVEIDGDGNCFARAVASALCLPSYQEVKARTKTFFLEQLPALTTTATGEPNTDFYARYPALSALREQPTTFQAVNQYFATDGDFATDLIFQLTAMALNTTIDLESLTKPGNYIARYEPLTNPAGTVINLLMREDRACSMYEETSNGDFRELSLSDGHLWGVTVEQSPPGNGRRPALAGRP